MRKLMLTEEQFQAVMYVLDNEWDIYATMKSDDCVDPDDMIEHTNSLYPELEYHSDEWYTKYEELEQEEVDRINTLGYAMKEVLDMMIKDSAKNPTTEQRSLVDRLYAKYLWDWHNGGPSDGKFSGGRITEYMWDSVPNSYTDLIEAIYMSEYPDKKLPADEDDENYDPDVADDFYDNDPEWLACEEVAKLIVEYDL